MSKELDFTRLSIKEMIVHDIPKHKLNEYSVEPMYSDKTSTITDGLRVFFKQKVVDSLKSDRAIKVVYNDESISPVQLFATTLFDSATPDFIQASKDITKHLYTIQSGNNSGGIIVFMNCTLESKKILLILKLEKDNGVQLEINNTTHSIDIKEIHDLMLTNRTKVFKIAALYDFEKFEIDYCGKVMDYQIDIKIKDTPTTFFIDSFLGCRPYKDPKTTTQEFYLYTKSYIKTIDDEIKRSKYLQDLNSYLQTNKQRISGREFADTYLTTAEHKDNYKEYLKGKNFKFDGFIKDTSMISNRIEKISMEFENGITILGKKGTFKDKVKLTKEQNGKTKAEIISKIKKVE